MESKDNTFDKILRAILGTTLIVMTIIALLQVLFRYVIKSSLAWSEEAARYLQIWLTFIGAAYAIKKGTHIAMTDIVSRMPKLVATGMKIFTDLLLLAFSVFSLYQGIQLVKATSKQTTPAIGIPTSLVYLSIPVGGAISIIYLCWKYIAKICERRKTNQEKEEL
ncbi:MAG: TRAP transporter small permease [Lachnospiraceae bacterium]|nr:TRAP transporter small permease [Lachnospiraceae bacterium]